MSQLEIVFNAFLFGFGLAAGQAAHAYLARRCEDLRVWWSS